MQKIQTFIWFNDQAEEAAKLYTSAIKNSKIISTMPGPGGKPMGVTVELDGREFILFNGGPQYQRPHSIPSNSKDWTSSQWIADIRWTSRSRRASRCSSIALHSMKSINSGISSVKVDAMTAVAGCKINSASPGRSFQRHSEN